MNNPLFANIRVPMRIDHKWDSISWVSSSRIEMLEPVRRVIALNTGPGSRCPEFDSRVHCLLAL